MKNKRPLFFIPALSGLLIQGLATAGQVDTRGGGTAAATFLDISPSVRAAALGGDQVAAHGEAGAMFSNPAGIGSLQIPELSFSHNQSFIGSKYDTLDAALPARDHVFGFSAQYIDDGAADRTGADSTNQPILDLGRFHFATTLLNATYARRLGDRLTAGVTAKGWSEQRDGQTRSSWAADGGVQMRSILPSLDLGFAYRNFGPNVDGYALPKSLALGGAYHWLFSNNRARRVSLFSELDLASYRKNGLRLGLEIQRDFLWLRAGYENLTSDVNDTLSQFSFGAGVRIKGWRIDYAWIPRGDLGDQQRVAVSIGFGMTPEERDQAAREMDLAIAQRARDHAGRYAQEGQNAAKAGDWQAAQQAYNQAIVWDPDSKAARDGLALAKDKLKFAQAEKFYREGVAFAKDKQYLDAALRWQQTLTLAPNHKEARASLAAVKSKMAAARAEGTASAATDKIFNQGIFLYVSSRYGEAQEKFQQVLHMEPDYPHIREYVEKAKNMKLEQQVLTLSKQNQSPKQASEKLAQDAYTYYNLGQIDKAIATWERVVALDPDNADAQDALKRARARRSLTPEKEMTRSKSVTELNALAVEAYSEGRLDRAAVIWRQALVIEPRNQRIENNLKRVEAEMAEAAPGR